MNRNHFNEEGTPLGTQIKNGAMNAIEGYLNIMPLSGLGIFHFFRDNHTPLGMLTADVRNTTINRAARAITRNPQTTLVRPKPIRRIPKDQETVLRRQITEKLKESPRGSWTENDWIAYHGNYANGDDNIFKRAVNPDYMLENTLGRYDYNLMPNGSVHVTDIYDYNPNGSLPDEWFFRFLTKFAQKYGSSEFEPDEQKYQYDLYVDPIVPAPFTYPIRKEHTQK